MKCIYTLAGLLISMILVFTLAEPILAQNKVGINTTSPKETVHVMGGLLAEGQVLIGNSDSVIVYTMGMGPSSSTDTSGVLYDSGGPTGEYGNNEDLDFTIQGTGNAQYLRVMVDSMDAEAPYDRLILAWNNGTEDTLTGTSTGVFEGVHPLAIHFHSNEVNTAGGFNLHWNNVFPVLEDSVETSGPGGRFHWVPGKYSLRSGFVNGDQWDADNIGEYSVATGYNTLASGAYSIAMGYKATGSGSYSNSIGLSTTASGTSSTALGRFSTASGIYSTAIGNSSTASGNSSTALGYGTEAIGNYAMAFGFNTDATGVYSTALGVNSIASGGWSTAMGNGTTASGSTSTSLGYNTAATGTRATAFGSYTDAHASTSVALGRFNIGGGNPNDWVDSDPLFEIGIGTSASDSANAMTIFKNAGALWSGEYDINSPDPPPAEGAGTRMMWYPKKGAFRAGSIGSTEWDKDSIGAVSVAMGSSTTAKGAWSFAVGFNTKAMGSGSTALGITTKAIGYASTAMGDLTKAIGSYSTAIGYNCTAGANISLAIGRNNVGGGNPTTWVETDPLFEIGIGTSESDSANAMTIFKNGGALWGGPYDDISPDPPPAEGPGSRMIWYPNKAAFRAGVAAGTEWDKDSVGYSSVAIGQNVKAKGWGSVAFGHTTSAYSDQSTALGFNTKTNGYASMAQGVGPIANGYATTALGFYTKADAYASVVLGRYNVGGGNGGSWVETDPVFEIGRGTINDPINAMTVLKNGNVGIGLSSPQTLLEINGVLNGYSGTSASDMSMVVRRASTSLGEGPAIGFSADNTHAIGAKIVHIRVGSNSAGDLAFYTKSGSTLSERMRIAFDGNVGIGTSFPGQKLDVNGGMQIDGGTLVVDPVNNRVGISVLNPSETLDVNGNIRAYGGPGTALYANVATTRVGIGTSSPDNKLHVVGGTDAGLGGGGYLQMGLTTSGNLVLDDNEIMARSNGSGTTLYVNNDGGNVILAGGSSAFVGIGTSSPGKRLDVNGGAKIDGTTFVVDETNNRVGIGTSSPQQALHVEGTIEVDQMIKANDSGGLDLATDEGTVRIKIIDAGNVGIGTLTPGSHKLEVAGTNTGASGAAGRFINGALFDGIALSVENTSPFATDNALLVTTQGTGNIASFDSWHGNGSWDREFRFEYDGDGYADNSWTVGGADYAEYFPKADEDELLEPGDLISMSPEASYTVSIAHGSNSQLLVGVYSTNPGFIGNGSTEGAPENSVLVGLLGVVPTKVCTENGTIRIGDFLTISSLDGVAMKAVTDGMVIGRAMEDYNASMPGLIKVLISPQWLNRGDDSNTKSLEARIQKLEALLEDQMHQ